jgi:hypothetical protein
VRCSHNKAEKRNESSSKVHRKDKMPNSFSKRVEPECVSVLG